jgi:hypothetical protein
MDPTPTLKDWHLGDSPGGHLEIVGTLVDDPGQGTVPDFHTGPLVRFVGHRLILAENGRIYRLLPPSPDRRFAPELLVRLGPASWRAQTPKRPGENHS